MCKYRAREPYPPSLMGDSSVYDDDICISYGEVKITTCVIRSVGRQRSTVDDQSLRYLVIKQFNKCYNLLYSLSFFLVLLLILPLFRLRVIFESRAKLVDSGNF